MLYLDAKTHTHIEEFSTSNFVGFADGGRTFVTPDSPSVLKSVTNTALRVVAADLGMKVEVRPVPFTEVASFSEVAACGTAVVLSPVQSCVQAFAGRACLFSLTAGVARQHHARRGQDHVHGGVQRHRKAAQRVLRHPDRRCPRQARLFAGPLTALKWPCP